MFVLAQRLDDQAGAVCHADNGLRPQQAHEVAHRDVRVCRAEHADQPHLALLSPLCHREGGCRAGVCDGPRLEVRDIHCRDGVAVPCGLQMLLLVGAPDQCWGVGPSWLLTLAWGAEGVQQDCQGPRVRRHIVGLGGLVPPIDSGHERQATAKCGRERQESDRVATGRRQSGDRKTTGKRQESGREAAGSNRRATGRRQRRCDRRATGKRQGGDRVATGRRQGSNRKQDIATG